MEGSDDKDKQPEDVPLETILERSKRRPHSGLATAYACLTLIGLVIAILLVLRAPLPSPTGYVISPGESLLDPAAPGFSGKTRSESYDTLVDGLFANDNVVTTIDDALWIPWFSSSSSCALSDLQDGGNCNSGESIDFTHNCMVTDEMSQVGILVSMGTNQTRMDQFVRMLQRINSTNGDLPAWRVYRDGTSIEPCRSGINGGCDTASDATARFLIALYSAANNSRFSDQQSRDDYLLLANRYAASFVAREMVIGCKESSLGYGQICYWLAAGSNSKSGGLGGTDFGYTGYYADAIIAMLQACTMTGNETYCRVAGNLTLNYLQASAFDGTHFSVPPGRSFHWTNLSGIPKAECTNTCSPTQWDSADAPRALGMCQANYYAQQVNVTLPGLEGYCDLWAAAHLNEAARPCAK